MCCCIYCKSSHSEKPQSTIILSCSCVNEHSAAFHCKMWSVYIYLIKSLDYRTKRITLSAQYISSVLPYDAWLVFLGISASRWRLGCFACCCERGRRVFCSLHVRLAQRQLCSQAAVWAPVLKNPTPSDSHRGRKSIRGGWTAPWLWASNCILWEIYTWRRAWSCNLYV